jgi:hypothetical protein
MSSCRSRSPTGGGRSPPLGGAPGAQRRRGFRERQPSGASPSASAAAAGRGGSVLQPPAAPPPPERWRPSRGARGTAPNQAVPWEVRANFLRTPSGCSASPSSSGTGESCLLRVPGRGSVRPGLLGCAFLLPFLRRGGLGESRVQPAALSR